MRAQYFRRYGVYYGAYLFNVKFTNLPVFVEHVQDKYLVSIVSEYNVYIEMTVQKVRTVCRVKHVRRRRMRYARNAIDAVTFILCRVNISKITCAQTRT